MLYSATINVMVKAARRAGRSLKRDLGEIEHLQVSLKGPANFVSLADKRAEEILYQDLAKARPGYGFIGEEGGTREGSDKSHTWIVDPLDGTTNFLHGIPQFAISIGLAREGTVIAGVIYNPANDELYTAERGEGAFLNAQRLRVAGRRKLADCVIACGLPHIGRGDHAQFRAEMMDIQDKVAGLRRFGAASLDLAFVAAGRLDGYWERNLSPWDIAAGQILVREAGGIVSGIEGHDNALTTGNVVCGNEFVHGELVKILKGAETEELLVLQRQGVVLPPSLQHSRAPRLPDRTFERVAIPAAEIGRGPICALKKRSEHLIRIGRCAHDGIRQEKLPKFPIEVGARRRDLRVGKALGGRIGVEIEGRKVGPATAGPEAGGRNLITIGLARYVVGQTRNAARVKRGRTPGEAGHGKIKTAPEEMHGTDFSDEGRTKPREDADDGYQRFEETRHRLGIVRPLLPVMRE